MISIAICDDEAVFAEALHALVDAGMKEILYGENSMDERELSYEITVFTNPLMMIDALKTKRFDLAFLDLLMNEESGFGVAEQIRRMRLNTEIAIVTSYGEARNDAFQYRPIGYVDKPATIEEVTRLLRLYIDFYSDCKRYIYVGRASEERRIAVNDVTSMMLLISKSADAASKSRCQSKAEKTRLTPRARFPNMKKNLRAADLCAATGAFL